VHDVNAAAVGLPARNAGSIVFVGIGDAAVVFLFEFVLGAAGVGVAPLPERLDKLLPLVVSAELLEGRPLLRGDDVRDFFAQPLLVSALVLLLDGLPAALL